MNVLRPPIGRWRPLAFLATTIALLFAATQGTCAQQTIKKMYGVSNDEFLLGGWGPPLPDTLPNGDLGSFDLMWRFCDSLRITTIHFAGEGGVKNSWLEALNASPARQPWHKAFVKGVGPIHEGGHGNEAVFYLMDSSRFANWQCRFTYLDGGGIDTNLVEKNDFRRGAGERIFGYETANATTPGQLVGSDIAFNWNPTQVNRWKTEGGTCHPDSTVQNAKAFVQDLYRRDTLMYVTVTGHLFEPGTFSGPEAATNDSLLRVEVWYEADAGDKVDSLFAGGHSIDSAMTNRTYPIAELLVRKNYLVPPLVNGQRNWNAYQSVSLPFHPRWCASGAHGVTGPLYPGNTSQQLNLKVYWTGAEKVAVRSIALRDSLAEMVLGDGPNSVEYRRRALDSARLRLYGMVNPGPTDTLRRWIIGLTSGIEQSPIRIACLARIEKLLRDSIPVDPARMNGDTTRFPAWSEGQDPISLGQIHDPDVAVAEFGMWANSTTWLHWAFRTPYALVPAIPEHNGGRFNIPPLLIDSVNVSAARDSVESYETTLQRYGFGGQYAPASWQLPLDYENWSPILNFGRRAAVARDQNLRFVTLLFNVCAVGFLPPVPPATNSEAFVNHLPEASELRALSNLALCYGTKGLIYQVLGSANNTQSNVVNGDWWGYTPDFGTNGMYTGDTWQNWFSVYPFLTRDPNTGLHHNATERNAIADFYVGWGNRTREIRHIDTWIADHIGPS